MTHLACPSDECLLAGIAERQSVVLDNLADDGIERMVQADMVHHAPRVIAGGVGGGVAEATASLGGGGGGFFLAHGFMYGWLWVEVELCPWW